MSARWDADGYPVYPDRSQPQGWGTWTAAGACSCTGSGSCRRCTGESRDDWAVEKGAREAERHRAHLMRTSPAFRAAWLATFANPQLRADMAVHADNTYGPMALTDYAEEATA